MMSQEQNLEKEKKVFSLGSLSSGFLSLVTLLVLVCGSLGQPASPGDNFHSPQTPKRHFSKSFFKEHVEIGEEKKLSHSVQYMKLLYLSMQGLGRATARVFLKKEGQAGQLELIQQTTCTSLGLKTCILWNKQISEASDEKYQVDVTFQAFKVQNSRGLTVELLGGELLETSTGHFGVIQVGKTASLDILVSFENIKELVASQTKIQFFALRGYQSLLDGTQYLKMYVKKGDIRVNSKNMIEGKTSAIGTGTVITLLPKDKSFCVKPSCKYSIHLDVSGISEFVFSTQVFQFETPLFIRQNAFVLEHLREDNDYAIYTSQSDRALQTNWRVNLIPIEGNPDVYIHFDEKPAKKEDYHWKSTFDSSEEVMITRKAIKEAGLKGDKIYLLFTSSKPTTFWVQIQQLDDSINQRLFPNRPLTSEVAKDKLRNYNFQFFPSVPEKLILSAQLTILSGNSDLYFKHCPRLPCNITEEEIEAAAELSKTGKNSSLPAPGALVEKLDKELFRSTEGIHGPNNDKPLSLSLAFNCMPPTRYAGFDTFLMDKSEEDGHSKLKTFDTCSFAIAVKGREESNKYTLELQGGNYHTEIRMVNTYSNNFKVEKYQKIYYFAKINPNSIPKGATGLSIRFTILSGDANVYSSKKNPFPSEAQHDKEVKIDNKNDQYFSAVKKIEYTVQKGFEKELEGTYYFGIEARQYIFGSISLTFEVDSQSVEPRRPGQPPIDSSKSSKSILQASIKFGQSLNQVTQFDEYKYHVYNFNLAKNQENKASKTTSTSKILVKINRVEGPCDFCVVKATEKKHGKKGFKKVGSYKKSDCLWTDEDFNDSIIITKDDPNFDPEGFYRILVFPIKEKYDVSDNSTILSYSLFLGSDDSFVEIYEGMVYKQPSLVAPKYFKLKVTPEIGSNETIAILLSSFDPDAELSASIVKDDLNEDNKVPSEFFSRKSAQNSALHLLFKRKTLELGCIDNGERTDSSDENSCYLYIKIKPSVMMNYNYKLMAFSGEKPIFLSEDQTVSLPSPKLKTLKAAHPISSQRAITLNVYSEHHRVKVVASLHDKDPKKDIPHLRPFVTQDVGTNVIHIPARLIKQFKHPFLKLEIANSDPARDNAEEGNKKPVSGQDYDYRYMLQVQISVRKGLQRLSNMVPIEDNELVKGGFRYYRFYKPKAFNSMVYLQVFSGEVDLYANLGSIPPTYNNFTFRSNTLKNDELVLPAKILQPGETNKYEYYTIGVYARQSSWYRIVASKMSSFDYIPIISGQILTRTVSPKRPLLLSYHNLQGKPFQLGFGSGSGKAFAQYSFYKEGGSQRDFFDEMPSEASPRINNQLPGLTQSFNIRDSTREEGQDQFLFLIKSDIQEQVQVYFSAEHSEPLNLKVGEEFRESLAENQCRLIIIKYEEDIFDEQISITATSEKFTLQMSEKTQGILKDDSKKQIIPNGQVFNAKISSFINKRLNSPDDPTKMLINQAVLKLCSEKGESTYSVRAQKPATTFTKLFPSSRLSLPLTEKTGYFYYKVVPSFVKKLQLRLEIPKFAYKGYDLNAILNHLEFVYITSDDFGFDKEFSGNSSTAKNTIPANILKKDLIKTSDSDQTSYYGIDFSVNEGLFMVRSRGTLQDEPPLRLQLILNDFRVMSPAGTTIQSVRPGEKVTFQLLKPTQASVDLYFSICKGRAHLSVYSLDPEGLELPWAETTFGGTWQEYLPFLPGETDPTAKTSLPGKEKHSNNNQLKLKVLSPTLFITLTGLPPETEETIDIMGRLKPRRDPQDLESLVTINSLVTSEANQLSLRDYFDKERPTLTLSPSDLIVDSGLTLPSQAFDLFYTQLFERVEVVVKVLVRDVSREEKGRMCYWDSGCCVDCCAKFEGPIYTQTAKYTVNKINGSVSEDSEARPYFDWPEKATVLTIPMKTLKKHHISLTGATELVVEKRLIFMGKYDFNSDDDSQVLIKSTLKVFPGYGEIDLQTTPVITAIVVVVLALFCLIGGYYRQAIRLERIRRGERVPSESRESSTVTTNYGNPGNELQSHNASMATEIEAQQDSNKMDTLEMTEQPKAGEENDQAL